MYFLVSFFPLDHGLKQGPQNTGDLTLAFSMLSKQLPPCFPVPSIDLSVFFIASVFVERSKLSPYRAMLSNLLRAELTFCFA